ncbi:lysine 2,3-aminomutase [Candidatus Saccharibacteria bacterium]|nr:lysine 2,3-aminomutase [Candidatus Saccharibacteria bacterium]NIV72507.1 lysine 2,3-aminomutase [Calditrichia bacterium]NIW79905.1 lysine 2,3-aminomutase [Calditrichia bacterium]
MELAYKYQAYTLHNFSKIPQVAKISADTKFDIRVVAHVLPFKSNSYVINELINWDDVPNDPMYRLTFPQKEMLKPDHYAEMAKVLQQTNDREKIERVANRIRSQLNPHPAGQMEYNVPVMDGQKLTGIQHKYRETVLFFPRQGQTCHAYCSFCFRWPQFVGIDEWKFAMKETELLVDYLQRHPEVTDILFTGGDPMIMKSRIMAAYIDALLNADLPHLKTIRIGSKSLAFWPYKFLIGQEAEHILELFHKVVRSGRHLAYMAHFSHPRELTTPAVKKAIRRIRQTGAEIRTQSPLLKHINNSADIWADMWRKQVELGCVPYYMFVVRDTGAKHYFDVPLVEAWKIFRDAYQQVSGIARTVRGPSMSCNPGKVQILGTSEIAGEKAMVFNMLQGKNPDWVQRPFFAKYDENASWLDDLEPAFGEKKFFFQDELQEIENKKREMMSADWH